MYVYVCMYVYIMYNQTLMLACLSSEGIFVRPWGLNKYSYAVDHRVCAHIYIYIYVERERERERETTIYIIVLYIHIYILLLLLYN